MRERFCNVAVLETSFNKGLDMEANFGFSVFCTVCVTLGDGRHIKGETNSQLSAFALGGSNLSHLSRSELKTT